MRWSTTYDRCRWKLSVGHSFTKLREIFFFLGRTVRWHFSMSLTEYRWDKEKKWKNWERIDSRMKRRKAIRLTVPVFQFEIEGSVWPTAQWSRCRAAERTDSNALARTNNVRATHRALRTRKTWNYYHHSPSIQRAKDKSTRSVLSYLSKLGSK